MAVILEHGSARGVGLAVALVAFVARAAIRGNRRRGMRNQGPRGDQNPPETDTNPPVAEANARESDVVEPASDTSPPKIDSDAQKMPNPFGEPD